MAHEGPAELLQEVMMDEQQADTSQPGMGGGGVGRGGVISVTQSDVLCFSHSCSDRIKSYYQQKWYINGC